jgi:hypothetical protein
MKFTYGHTDSPLTLHEILLALLALESHGINLHEATYTVFTKGFTSPRISTLEVIAADHLAPSVE